MYAVTNKAWADKNAVLFRGLLRWLLPLGLLAFVVPQAIGVLIVVAGFAVANQTLQIVPETIGEALAVLLLFATATGLVLAGPWVGFYEYWEVLDSRVLFCLPHLLLLGTSAGQSFAGWLGIVALGSWLTFRYESLWPQIGVLLFSLAPMPIASIFRSTGFSVGERAATLALPHQ